MNKIYNDSQRYRMHTLSMSVNWVKQSYPIVYSLQKFSLSSIYFFEYT